MHNTGCYPPPPRQPTNISHTESHLTPAVHILVTWSLSIKCHDKYILLTARMQ